MLGPETPDAEQGAKLTGKDLDAKLSEYTGGKVAGLDGGLGFCSKLLSALGIESDSGTKLSATTPAVTPPSGPKV
jgi:hypothetical protein